MINISGFAQNGYYIGNPIIAEISDNQNQLFFAEMVLTNLTTGVQSSIFRAFADLSGLIILDFAPIIKAIFEEPSIYDTLLSSTPITVNEIKIAFQFTYADGDTDQTNLTRKFIRGYKYDDLRNQYPVRNKLQKTTDILPMWAGLKAYAYYMDNDCVITSDNDPDLFQLQNTKSCKGVYLRFINSMGVVSYWYFETFEKIYKNNPLGVVKNAFDYTDLGAEIDIQMKLASKVKNEFVPIIRDLIYSPFVERFVKSAGGGDQWQRVKVHSNTITEQSHEKAVRVSVLIEDNINANPSLLWS